MVLCAHDKLADVEPEPIDAGEEYPSQVPARCTVCADYHLVLKGPDRGKWAFDVKAEADARPSSPWKMRRPRRAAVLR